MNNDCVVVNFRVNVRLEAKQRTVLLYIDSYLWAYTLETLNSV